MNMSKIRHALLASYAVAVFGLGAPAKAFADEHSTAPGADMSAPSAADQVTNHADAGRVEEIVVTAQHRGENLQAVPIAITALTGETLSRSAIRGTEDLTLVTPGLIVGRQLQAVQPNIRGVGVQDASPGNEGTVALYVDDVYVPQMTAKFMSLQGIERIEVLKGPQGTLFGRNATGGAMQIITKDPGEAFRGQIFAGYGNYDTYEAGGLVEGALAPGVAGLVSVYTSDQRNGWGRNIFTGTSVNKGRDFVGRAKVKITPGNATDIILAADYASVRNSFGIGRQVVPGSLLADRSGYLGSHYDVRSNVDPSGKTEQWGVSAKLSHDLDWATLMSLTGYRDVKSRFLYDQDATPVPTVNVDFGTRERSLTQELRLVSPSGEQLTWVVGLFYFHYNAGYDPLRLSGTSQAPFTASETQAGQIAKAYAAFGQATLAVTPTTNLTAGLRYTSEKHEFDGRIVRDGVVRPETVTIAEKTWSKLTWRLAIDQKIDERAMIYASFSRGFKSGLFNPTNLANPPVNPEVLDAYEAGFKSQWLDNKLRLNGSAFLYKYDDIQTTQRNVGGNFLLNAARARLKGLDLDAQLVPVPGLSLRASAAFIFEAKFLKFDNAPITSPRATGGNLITPGNAAGNRLVRTPKRTVTLGADYRWNIGVGELAAGVNYYRNSGYFWEVDNRLRQPAYGLLNGQLSWTSPSRAIELAVWGRNLTNHEYYSSVVESANGDIGSAAAPRTYGVSVRTRW